MLFIGITFVPTRQIQYNVKAQPRYFRLSQVRLNFIELDPRSFSEYLVANFYGRLHLQFILLFVEGIHLGVVHPKWPRT